MRAVMRYTTTYAAAKMRNVTAVQPKNKSRFTIPNTRSMLQMISKANTICSAAMSSGRKNTSNICLLMARLISKQ